MDNNPSDPNSGGGGMPGGGMPAGDQPTTPPAQPTDQPAQDTTPVQEEKCSTCEGAASGGNCTMCAQPTASCTCPPAQAGGGPTAPAV